MGLIKIIASSLLIFAIFILLLIPAIGFKGILTIILIGTSIYWGISYEKNKTKGIIGEEVGKPASIPREFE